MNTGYRSARFGGKRQLAGIFTGAITVWSDAQILNQMKFKKSLKALDNTVIFSRLSPCGQWTDSTTLYFTLVSRITPVAPSKSANAFNSVFFCAVGQKPPTAFNCAPTVHCTHLLPIYCWRGRRLLTVTIRCPCSHARYTASFLSVSLLIV